MNFRSFSAAVALSGASLLSLTAPVQAQAPVSAATVRALNLARNTAVSENGGLSVYRPQPCMFNTGDGGGECLISNTAEGFTFKFLGGKPGWPENGSEPTTETEIQISPDGRSINQIIYNGSPR
jgi:hypothetical protein